MPSEKQKVSEAGEQFLATLSPRARARMARVASGPLAQPEPPEDDDDAEAAGAAFLATLSPRARARLLRVSAAPARTAHKVPAEKVSAKYGVCESPDGGYARTRLYKTPEALARRLQQLEGSETVVSCFYGVPLPVSKGPQRYLDLPGGGKIKIPMYAGGPCEVVTDEQAGGPEPEEAGFLGPPELFVTQAASPGSNKPTGGDDEEDDE